MIRNSLKIVEKVGKDKPVLNGTFAFLQTKDVIELDPVAKIVNDLLQGLNVGGLF